MKLEEKTHLCLLSNGKKKPVSVYIAMARTPYICLLCNGLKTCICQLGNGKRNFICQQWQEKKHICLLINDKKKYMSFYLQWQEKLYFCLLGNGKKPIYLSMASFLSFLKGLFSCTKKIKFLSLNKYYY